MRNVISFGIILLISGCNYFEEHDDLKVNKITYKSDNDFEIIFSSSKDYTDRKAMGGASYIFCKPKKILNHPRSLDPESAQNSISIYIMSDDPVIKQGTLYIYKNQFMVSGKTDFRKNGSKYLCQRFTGSMMRSLIKSEIFEIDISK
ncbi:hypothetical protein [Acinetobacter wuhouensis]|uniref:Lipoprotein n=1 Tax=Acinetobacter wuhouensis TaxID=1879050 RepID=A0A4Q7AJF8_9GAMM|nr:hypothetical protein [Acinetobacter wuhouensis]RZG45811.1 hypothetical protein EXU28_11380 [Acinetobacter wuhouensis]